MINLPMDFSPSGFDFSFAPFALQAQVDFRLWILDFGLSKPPNLAPVAAAILFFRRDSPEKKIIAENGTEHQKMRKAPATEQKCTAKMHYLVTNFANPY